VLGKTSLVYHLAWMFKNLGLSVVAADFDPQANLTAAFLEDERIEELAESAEKQTLMGALQPLAEPMGELREPYVEIIEERLALLVGDLDLSTFEDKFSKLFGG
jgi:chromosome partitioning protein